MKFHLRVNFVKLIRVVSEKFSPLGNNFSVLNVKSRLTETFNGTYGP